MAKEKKPKELKPVEEPEKKEKELIGFEFRGFRIIKFDDLNWAIERKNSRNCFSASKRRYYPKLESVLIAAMEEMTLTMKEEKSLKKGIRKINEFKEEIIKAASSIGKL